MLNTFSLNIPFYTFVAMLEHALRDCDTVLDVGCGEHSPLRHVPRKKYTVGIDGYAPDVAISKGRGIHDAYYVADIQELGKHFAPKSFDAVIALDVIEHLERPAGEQLLQQMETIAKKRVIVVTPNGFIEQKGRDNALQHHLSGWSVSDFTKDNYRVQGLHGWKPLRKEEGSLRYKPKVLWGLISEITHRVYTKNHPEHAFCLFADKNVG